MAQETVPKRNQPSVEARPSWETVAPSPESTEAGRRRLVSVQRLQHALAFRLGCRPSGDRGPGGSYWRTHNGIRFLVSDPTFDRDSASVVSAGGTRELFYSYKYAAALLYHVLWLNSGSHAIHGPRGPEPVQMRPSAEAMGVMLEMTADVLRDARAMVQQGVRAADRRPERPLDE